MSQYHGNRSDDISRWHLVEHLPTILNALAFCIHVNQATPHIDIKLQTILNDLLMNMHALFKRNHTSTCIQHPPQKWQSPTAHLLVANNSYAFWPWLHFTCPNTMVIQVMIFQDGILLNTLQASSMLPHFAYMLTKLLHKKTSISKPLWTICWWTHLPSSSAISLVHAINTPTKAIKSNHNSCCILWK